MPRWVQLVAELNPVRHFVAISRAVLVKGATLREIEQPFLILVVFAAAVFSMAVRQYSKRAA
jgi:ABC-2 type transport system permease protein